MTREKFYKAQDLELRILSFESGRDFIDKLQDATSIGASENQKNIGSFPGCGTRSEVMDLFKSEMKKVKTKFDNKIKELNTEFDKL